MRGYLEKACERQNGVIAQYFHVPIGKHSGVCGPTLVGGSVGDVLGNVVGLLDGKRVGAALGDTTIVSSRAIVFRLG